MKVYSSGLLNKLYSITLFLSCLFGIGQYFFHYKWWLHSDRTPIPPQTQNNNNKKHLTNYLTCRSCALFQLHLNVIYKLLLWILFQFQVTSYKSYNGLFFVLSQISVSPDSRSAVLPLFLTCFSLLGFIWSMFTNQMFKYVFLMNEPVYQS